ncbi:glycosyltransferase family 4 protein [Cellulomonas sp. URHE0023]|uniref:glycosyltransferase family 4 protein n=1 Tax=Cellulomonas sp. URHE0023 TaxID=1380354 RepID=UPI000555E26A|nr:glycosyltransferase family 4 protein [Cellulomonas sp. URHE0023]
MTRRLVVAHPSTELYGSDLQLVESVAAAVGAGWEVLAVLPGDGPLAERLTAAGATVRLAPFPVLRKSLLTPRGLAALSVTMARSTWQTARWLRRSHVDAVYVNTLTIPSWIVAARAARVPVVCHVHEAEEDQSTVITAGLTAPLLLAHRIIANSEASRRATGRAIDALGRRTTVVHNGVPGPPEPPVVRSRVPGAPLRLVLVGRLSPRKGSDVAVSAVAELVDRGHDVVLRLAGDVFEGYEWFREQLREQIVRDHLEDRVELLGFVHPTWPELADADVVLVPSLVEPFGNTAVEALLAGRPVVASNTQGLAEIVRDGDNGLLVPPGDVHALASAVARLDDDPGLAADLARHGLVDASARFSRERYANQIVTILESLRSRPAR